MEMPIPNTRCGYVALVGRPNVGKSTLINRLLGHRLCITSHKPQTTRNSILGILTDDDTQVVLIDTPGMHTNQPRNLNRYMNRAAYAAAEDADISLLLVEAGRWTEDDDWALNQVKERGGKAGLVVNKIDWVERREELMPFLQEVTAKHDFAFVVPISAKKGKNVEPLLDEVRQQLPKSEFFYGPDQLTDKSERFIASEIVREQVLRCLHQELPYTTSVEVEAFEYGDDRLNIAATIWVERSGQKAIVIGKQGQMLKTIGERARKELQRQFDTRVYLETWVKVRENWTDDARALRNFGYD